MAAAILQDNQFESEEVSCPAPEIKDEKECLLNDWSVKNLVKKMICMKMIHIFDGTSLWETKFNY